MRLFLIAACVMIAASAWAQNAKPGRITATTATMQCPRGAATPTCAAEALLVCLARGTPQTCDPLGVSDVRAPDEPMQTEYVIERVSVIKKEDITDDLRDVEWYKPGYALIEILRRACPARQRDCQDDEWEDVQVYARPIEGKWEIVAWRSSSEPDEAPEIPDGFRGLPTPP